MNFKSKQDLILSALFTGCFFLCSCENNLEQVKSFNKKNVTVEVGKNVVIKYSVGGNKKAILTGAIMNRVQDTVPYVEFPNKIHVDFYNIQDSIESKLDAHYARYIETQSKVFLKDSVRVINIKGDTLYCDELYWDRSHKDAEFYTDKPVRIRTKTETLNGIGMVAQQDFKEWTIVHPTGVVKVGAAEFPN